MTTHTSHLHFENAAILRDDELLARVADLARTARGTTAELIAHLAEIEQRKLHLASGYSSLFTYCREALHLSEHAAYHRIEAARAARRFPVILDMLAEGAVNLTTVRLIARQLTTDNHAAVLERARGLSKSEVERLVAELAPIADVPTSVRKLPAAAAPPIMAPPLPTPTESLSQHLRPVPLDSRAPAAQSPTPPAATVAALSPERYKLQLTIGGDTLEKLRLAKDMLRHAVPSGNEAEILDRALSLLLADLAKKKFAATERPKPAREAKSGSRTVPAEVRRAVFVRDLGRCAFVGKDGHRCRERGFLEFHHVHPYAEGGTATVGNIQLRCRRHNVYDWECRSTAVRRIEEEWWRVRLGPGRGPRPARSGSS